MVGISVKIMYYLNGRVMTKIRNRVDWRGNL